MLTIKTYIKESTIPNSGYGLFLTSDIIENQIIWKKDTNIDSIVQDKFYKQLKQDKVLGVTDYIEKYGTVDKDGLWYIDSYNCKYINHSKEKANIIFKDDIAIRDIKEDEELFCDYELITENWHYKELLNL